MNQEYKRCIICGKIKQTSDEHIIPKALGNKTLHLYDICKECNEGLGKYVDEHLCNNFISELYRMQYGLKGQSGKSPNPFKTGKMEDGTLVEVDSNFKIRKKPTIKDYGYKIEVSTFEREEGLEIIKKKLKRKGYTDKELDEMINNSKEHKVIDENPKISYTTEINSFKILIGILKIAYEYAYYILGDLFYNDCIAQKIRGILYDGAQGIFKYEYGNIFPIQNIRDILPNEILSDEKIHLLQIIEKDNKIYVLVSLFLVPFFSYNICVSEDASKYDFISEDTIFIIKLDEM